MTPSGKLQGVVALGKVRRRRVADVLEVHQFAAGGADEQVEVSVVVEVARRGLQVAAALGRLDGERRAAREVRPRRGTGMALRTRLKACQIGGVDSGQIREGRARD